MTPETFLQTHPVAVLVTLAVLVILYVGLSWFLPVARKTWAPKEGTFFDAILDLGEAFLVYSPKVVSALKKLSGAKFAPALTLAEEVIEEIRPMTVGVTVTVQPTVPVAPDPHVVEASPSPDDVVTGDMYAAIDAIEPLEPADPTPRERPPIEPHVSEPPRGAS